MNYFYLYLQLIYVNTFFASQTLKITSLITKGHYQKITNYTYAYDLTITLLITYAITVISNLSFSRLSLKKLFLYQFATITSALIFALLGQVKFLQNFTLSGQFWKHLTLREIIVFIIRIYQVGLIFVIVFYYLRIYVQQILSLKAEFRENKYFELAKKIEESKIIYDTALIWIFICVVIIFIVWIRKEKYN